MKEKKNPLVSVIIPTYNRAEFLLRCLRSVFIQDYEPIEIIIVDDCSKVPVFPLLQTLDYSKFPILVINFFEHKGQCSARNAGLNAAKGKYIQMLDDDDELPPNKIKKQVEFLEFEPDVGIVYGNLHVYQGSKFSHIIHGTDANYNLKETFIHNLKQNPTPMVNIAHSFTPDRTYFRISTGTGLYRKNNLRYDTHIERNFNIGADLDMWCQMIFAGMKFKHLEMPGLYYHVHEKNLSINRERLSHLKIQSNKYFIEKYQKRLGIK